MGIVHLKGQMLLDYLEGRLDDQWIRAHVAGCEICRARLRDERLLRVLVGGDDEAPVDHPDEDTLAAYLDECLDGEKTREVERHLAGCDECLAHCLELRRLVEAPATADMPARLVDVARDALATRVIGTLYLNVGRDRVLLFYMPEPQAVPERPRGSMQGVMRSTGARRMSASSPPPGKERSRKAGRPESYSASESMSLSDSLPAFARRPPDGGDLGRAMIPVDADLELEVTSGDRVLSVAARDPATGAPREGVRIRLEIGRHLVDDGVTGPGGTINFKSPVADIPARLVLPGPPQRAVDLQVV